MSSPKRAPRISLAAAGTPHGKNAASERTMTLMTPEQKALLEKKGCLEVLVASAHHLPYKGMVPKSVVLQTGGLQIRTGPPKGQQKNTNSFQFATEGGKPAKLVQNLRELYQGTLKIQVAYDDEFKYLEAELPLRQLVIDEPKWLILDLYKPGGESSGESETETKEGDVLIPPPTIKIKFKLSGPYRAEFAALVSVANAWFGVVDKVEGAIVGSPIAKAGSAIKGHTINKNYLLIPLVPVAAILVAAAPLLGGVIMVSIPFLLPVVLILIGLLAATLASGGLLYSSTKTGRGRIGYAFAPLTDSFKHSRAGQALIYDTGPRPTPVSVCQQILPVSIWAKLWISLVIDLIGSSSYLLPVVGEGFDLAWAPAQTILIMAMYDATSPNLKYLSFTEEVLPFTDVVPSACIGWACEFLPPMFKDHVAKNDIQINPDVTKAVVQLATTAAKMAKNNNNNKADPTMAATTPTQK